VGQGGCLITVNRAFLVAQGYLVSIVKSSAQVSVFFTLAAVMQAAFLTNLEVMAKISWPYTMPACNLHEFGLRC
jgi:hypothetical protein